MKLHQPKRREPGLRAGEVLRAPQEPTGPEKPRITPELAKIMKGISPFSNGEIATIVGQTHTLLPEEKVNGFILRSITEEVWSLAKADPAYIERDLLSYEKLSYEPAKALLALALLNRDLPPAETKILAKTCWEYCEISAMNFEMSVMAILGAKILLPELLPEIQAFQEQLLASFRPEDAGYEYSPEMLNRDGLYTRALIKLLAPEWADQLALPPKATERITKEINRLKDISGPTTASLIFSLSILNHPDVHLVPGVGLDFHPRSTKIYKSEPLPERPSL